MNFTRVGLKPFNLYVASVGQGQQPGKAQVCSKLSLGPAHRTSVCMAQGLGSQWNEEAGELVLGLTLACKFCAALAETWHFPDTSVLGQHGLHSPSSGTRYISSAEENGSMTTVHMYLSHTT